MKRNLYKLIGCIVFPALFNCYGQQENHFNKNNERNNLHAGTKIMLHNAGYPKASPEYVLLLNYAFQLIVPIKKQFHLEVNLSRINKALILSYDEQIIYRNITVPAYLLYKRKNIYFAGGVFCDYLIPMKNNENNTYKNLGIKRFSFGYSGLIGYSINLTPKLKLYSELQLFNSLKEIYRHNQTFVNYGIGFGFNYRINGINKSKKE